MPALIGTAFISLLGHVGLYGAAVNIFGTIGLAQVALGVGYAVLAGASIALQLAFRQKPAAQQPSDVQANIRQEIFPRRRLYGTYLSGSGIVFGFRRGEKTYILHYICEGPIKGFVSFRLDRKPVTLDGDGFVTDAQYQYGGRSRVQILHTLGLMSDEPFQEILDAFPELNDPLKPFRHRGCAMVLQIIEQVPFEHIQDVYPNNLPALQVVVEGLNDIYDPRTDTSGHTDNAGLCLLAECMNVYGLTTADTEEIDFEAFASFADHCDEDVSLKAGGTEKRYRCSGVVTLDAENENRINAIASVCNADVFIDPEGRISVRQRLRTDTGIALREKNGDHLSIQIEDGRGLQKKFNRVNATYTDPNLNWKANEVSWRHAGMIAEDGQEYPQALNIVLCPSPTQAMRLAKLALFESNPEFAGSLTSGPQALELLADPVFTLDLSPENELERTALAIGAIEFDPESAVVSCSFLVPFEGATDWEPATDEQEEVEIPPELPAYVDDIPLDVSATVELLANSAPVIRFEWDAADGYTLPDSYAQQVEVSPAGEDDWSPAQVHQFGHRTARFGPVADGGAYDWRIRNVAAGKTFDWQMSSSPVTVLVDAAAPGALSSTGKSAGSTSITLTFTAPNSANYRGVNIYRASLPSISAAPGIYQVSHGAPSAASSWTNSGLAPGYYSYWGKPINISGVEGPTASFGETLIGTDTLSARSDFTNAAWSKTNITVTPAAITAAGVSMSKIEATATAATVMSQTVAGAGESTSNIFEAHVKKGSGASVANRFVVRNATTATDLISAFLNYDTGVFTGTGASDCTAEALPDDVWRIRLKPSSGISAGNNLTVYAGFAGGSQPAGTHFYLTATALFDG